MIHNAVTQALKAPGVLGMGGISSPSFGALLQSSLTPWISAGSPTPTFTRATTAYVLGYAAGAVIADGPVLLPCASGEARFMGARRVSEGVWSGVDANGVALTTTNGASSLCCDASGPLGYLAEGARTNRCLYSQVFSNAAWVSGGGGIAVTDNSIAAPDGTTTADTLTASGANGTLIQDLGVVASASKTGGLWLKRKTGTGNIDLTMDGGTGWTTVAVTSTWTRFSKNQTLADEDFGIRIVTSGDAVYAWQGQVETAAFLSSDIPTTTVAVARNADVLTYASAGNASIEQGSIYAELMQQSLTAGIGIVSINDGSIQNRAQLGGVPSSGNQASNGLVTSGNVSQASVSVGTAAVGVLQKDAMYWKTNSVNAFFNGSAGTEDTSVTVPASFTIIEIGCVTSLVQPFGTIRNMRIYPKALSASRLQAMTS